MNYFLRTGLLAMIAFPAAAQNVTADAPTIQALLSEIRQLRLALERSALLAPRMQLTMQRMQSQEQKVARISQQFETVRRQVAEQAAVPGKAAEELALLDQRLSEETDAGRRKQLADRRAEMKMIAARAVDQSLKARESELGSSLQAEQAALDDLNQKLNAMERLLDVPPPAAR